MFYLALLLPNVTTHPFTSSIFSPPLDASYNLDNSTNLAFLAASNWYLEQAYETLKISCSGRWPRRSPAE